MDSKYLQASKRSNAWGIFKAINILSFLLLCVVVSIVVWLWHRMQDSSAYPIENVKIITQGGYLRQSDVKKDILMHLHGGFFAFDGQALKEGLMENPWVKSVSMRRIWPSSLMVRIAEQQPLARWGADGILSKAGDVFYPPSKTIPSNLLQIQAPISLKDDVLSNSSYFNKMLSHVGLQLNKILVTQRMAWTVWLSNGIQVGLCRNQVRNRFADFVALYPKVIAKKPQDVISVNLCYPNGLAIRWRH